MKTRARYVTALVLILALGVGGCAQEPTRQDVGMVIGGAVGKSMDDVDRMKTAATLENVRTGVSSTWKNPDTGSEYTVTPIKTYETPAGPCREYAVDAVVDGKPGKVYGTACRQADSSWKIKS